MALGSVKRLRGRVAAGNTVSLLYPRLEFNYGAVRKIG
jgi:hypothetical protein